MDTSDILGQILSEESPDEILDHYTEDSDPTQLVRCSSRIAAWNPFSISEWPKERILATLYSLNVQVPPDLNQDQLLIFLQEVNQDPQPPSTNVSSLPRSTGRKATEKRKNISNDQASPTSKKVKTSNPPQASAQQGDDRVLTALLSIQGSLSDMDNRIQVLESERSASAPRAMFDGQTSSSTSNCALIPDLALPRRSLGSALPAASTGVPFFPPAAAISPQLRAQILSALRFSDNSMKITFTLFLAHLTCCFLVMDTSDILGQILSEESPDEILDHYTEDSDPTQLVRRSSRIAARNPFSISEWPKERILATLYSLNVQVPPDLNQDQLLTFLQEVNQDPQPHLPTYLLFPDLPAAKPRRKEKIYPMIKHLQLQRRLKHLIPLKLQHNRETTGSSQRCCQSKDQSPTWTTGSRRWNRSARLLHLGRCLTGRLQARHQTAPLFLTWLFPEDLPDQLYLPLPPGCPFSPQQLLFLPNCALKSCQDVLNGETIKVKAIIHGLCELQALSWQEAEEVFLRGPTYHPRYACNLHLQKKYYLLLHNIFDNGIHLLF
ncbi:hypothetical protein DPX16_17853 [Anabarilius grahami]|uniref:Uncharacterized protein n=1 Tax=Anabarilius grahami TaxID=495550 RepID=A0A3N0YG58_ANAGA|nr:hypothetical protein DPX16_17853 [Anabarilius grahami]